MSKKPLAQPEESKCFCSQEGVRDTAPCPLFLLLRASVYF